MGTLICLLGVDGSGKTTAAYRLCQSITESGQMCTCQRLAPSVLARVPTGLHRRAGKGMREFPRGDSSAVGRKSDRSPGLVTRTLALSGMVFHLIESTFVYALKLRPSRKRGTVIHDRYFYDYAIFYWDICPGWLRWCYIRLIPQPDAIFFLDVDPSIARMRDGEFSAEFYVRQRKRYLAFLSALKSDKAVVIDANASAQDVAGSIRDLLKGITRHGEGACLTS